MGKKAVGNADKHIKGVELEYRQKTDSINHKNDFNYE
jgi:hypothetical protein